MTASPSKKYRADPTAWCFVSGKIAALESELLPRSFFEAVLKSTNASEARSALGKSMYRSLFPDDAAVSGSSAVIDARSAEIRAEIFKLCPPHPLENYFSLPARFRSFRTLFNRMAKQTNVHADDFDALFPVFAVEAEFASAMLEHRQMLFRKSPPQTASPVERSLYLDSAACTLMSIVAACAPEPLARRYMADRAVLTAWSGIFRARWNGVPADMIRAWFVMGQNQEFAASVLASENDPKAAISSRLSNEAASALESVDAARIKADIDSAASDALRDTVLTCRLTPFGAERALSYLVAIEAELINLELCLSSVANGIDRRITASRLRREYA